MSAPTRTPPAPAAPPPPAPPSLSWLWFVLPPLLVFFLGWQFFGDYAASGIAFEAMPHAKGGAAVAYQSIEASGRYEWLSLLYLLMALCVLGTVGAYMALRHSVGWDLATALLIVAATVAFLIGQFAGDRATVMMFGGSNAHEVALKGTADSVGPILEQARTLIHHANFATSLASLMIVTASASCLQSAGSGVGAAVANLATQFVRLRNMLYLASVILVVGVLTVDAWYAWPGALLVEDHRPLYETLHRGLMARHAVIYSLVLATTYVPIVLVLSLRARTLAERVGAKASVAERATWMEKNGLSIKWNGQLARAVAVLAPVAAGPLVEILGRLVQHGAE